MGSRGSDPELFAALVPACRYCGLLRQSVAAHERATRLDPNVRTSVQHTFFMLGDYLRAADEAERSWAPGSAWGLALACAGHPDAQRVLDAEGERYAKTSFAFGPKAMNTLNPDRVLLRAAVDELVASGFRDPEGLFYQVIQLAHEGTSIAPSRSSRTSSTGDFVRTKHSSATRGSIPCGTVRTSTRFWK